MKLVHKLIVSFFVISALIWTAGVYAYKIGYRAMQDTYIRNNETLAREMMNSIDRSIHDRIEGFMSYSNDVMLQETIIKSNISFSKMPDVYSVINKRDREWTSAPKEQVTPFMQGLISNTLSDELREIVDFYARHSGYKLYGELFATNKFGANVAQTGKTTDYRQDDEEWWQLAKKDGLYMHDVKYEESAGIYSTDIAVRINDDKGDFIGVMKIVLNIEEVIDILQNKTRGGIYPEHNSMKTLLLTREGKIIFSNDKKDVFLDNVSHLMPGTEYRGTGEGSYFIRRNGSSRLLVTAAGSTGHMEYKGFNWLMMIMLDEKEAFAPLIQLRNKIAVVSFAVTLLALLAGVFISSRISGNVRKLRDASVKIGAGDLSCSINVGSKDEIGGMTLTFNKMVLSLKERTEALNNEILARMAAEEKSANSAQEWARTFDSITDLVSIHSNDFRIIRANQALAGFLGVSKEELAGKFCYEVFHGRKGPEAECPHVRTLETKKPVTVERCDRGTACHSLVSTSPIFNKQNEIIGTVHIVKNITEMKKLEEQLRHAQKMESVGQLAGGVAHDFNNILAAIINYNYLMRDMSPGDPGYLNAIDKISSLAERASHITRSLLSYSRKQLFELRHLNINSVIKNSVQDLRTFIGENIELVIHTAADDLMIMADEDQLGQCLMNLASNSRDAMPDGGTLTITTEVTEIDTDFILSHGFGIPGAYSLMSVTDTGAGMDEETALKIFEPFFSTKEVGKGTGLGLSMVFGIIRQHDGYIDVYSKQGHGTTFKLYFPLLNKEKYLSK
ncbi:MAG: PAS domain-containing protein [Nitrospirae bacterium]|nr:PAS domain-containing protein [Nitrospirota bacterium]